MAKTNNKGFTLVEIIIAVAILSVLLTPVVKQFATTMETSRKAKALQKVNEQAVNEVEEFQMVSKEDLDKKYGNPTVHSNLPVTLYDTSGNKITSTLTYSAYEYTLADSLIGAKKDKYSNVVVLDDLSNKVRAYGDESAEKHYKVAYGLTNTELSNFGSGFELTNEGSIVEYDETTGFIKSIVCTDTNRNNGTDVSCIPNPNEENLGNMHNLDKNTVAMIMGDTSSFDSEAFSTLFSKAMDHLREIDYDSWQQALLNVDNESILSQDSMSNSKRLIKIYMDETVDASSGENCYVVKVDVYYDYKYSLIVEGKATGNFHDMVSFTVFSQKFFTEEPPEIYFEYQPYCISDSNTADAVYQSDDYILIDNNVDSSKLYIYKPYKDQQNANASLSDYYTVDTDGDGEADSKAEYYTYYTDATKSRKVTIHMASVHENSLVDVNTDNKKDNKKTDEDDFSTDRMYIYTNLDVTGYDTAAADAQFVSDNYEGTFDYVKGENVAKVDADDDVSAFYTKYPLGNKFNLRMTDAEGTVVELADDDLRYRILRTLSEDTREADRLYTITVKLTPESNLLNTVWLSGAKGAN